MFRLDLWEIESKVKAKIFFSRSQTSLAHVYRYLFPKTRLRSYALNKLKQIPQYNSFPDSFRNSFPVPVEPPFSVSHSVLRPASLLSMERVHTQSLLLTLTVSSSASCQRHFSLFEGSY